MTDLPDLDGVLTAEEVAATAETIVRLQHADGMIPWYPGGHCDPWNHVETAMALSLTGHLDAAERAYEWLARRQRPDGSWHNYYVVDERGEVVVEDTKLDTNVCAYVADETPWEYALLTGSSSIWHALGCASSLAGLVGAEVPRWELAHTALRRVICTTPRAFAPKQRWAMDWYYPVLAGVMTGTDAERRLASRWETFVMPGLGVRCVAEEPWVTAAETAECAIAHAAAGDKATATELLTWTRAHRHDDGSYWTGIVYPDGVQFPDGERTAYTAAAVLLAADTISGTSPASDLFMPDDHPAGVDPEAV